MAEELEKRHTVKSLCDESLGEWVFKHGFEFFSWPGVTQKHMKEGASYKVVNSLHN